MCLCTSVHKCERASNWNPTIDNRFSVDHYITQLSLYIYTPYIYIHGCTYIFRIPTKSYYINRTYIAVGISPVEFTRRIASSFRRFCIYIYNSLAKSCIHYILSVHEYIKRTFCRLITLWYNCMHRDIYL